MKLGIIVEGQEGLTWDAWRRIATETERLGFDSLWRSDHLLSIIDEGRLANETWTALTVAAVETERLQIGSLVSPMSFRNPAMLAKVAMSVDSLSGGRLVLGVGAGWNQREHTAFGFPFPPLRERLARLEEGIEVILRMQEDGPATYNGEFYRVDAIDAHPRPESRRCIPLLIGGMGKERFLRIVARYADEWNMTTNSPDLYLERSERLAEQCAAIGREPGLIRRSVAMGVLIGGSERELERRCQALQRLIPHLAEFDTSAVPEAVRASGWVCGTPDEIALRLEALAAAGIDRVMLQVNDFEDLAMLEEISELVPG